MDVAIAELGVSGTGWPCLKPMAAGAVSGHEISDRTVTTQVNSQHSSPSGGVSKPTLSSSCPLESLPSSSPAA